MSKARIIGKITLSENHRNELAQLGVSYIANDNPKTRDDKEEIISRIGDAEAIVINISTPVTEEIIARCKNLRFIQTWSTGVDNIDLVAAKNAGIIVKNVPDFSTESVAEKTIGTMIFISSRLREANQDVISGGWQYTKFQGIELKGKVLGIVGKGKIGFRVAELAKAFGMEVVFADSKTDKSSLQKMLSISDFLSLHCPLTNATYHLIGRDEFRSMKKGIFIINNSRGGVVDEEELLSALNQGMVAYASMDVFENEPPSKDYQLVNHPNVFVTPHSAWNTQESVDRLTSSCINNLKAYLSMRQHEGAKAEFA
jgi:phosphoglycerate dehydrogenase-like enzyme